MKRDYIQTLRALETVPGGKEFIAACRKLAVEAQLDKSGSVSEDALIIAQAHFPNASKRRGQ